MPFAPGEGPIHVALTFDDGFWAPAYATMRSICLATRRRADLVFHLCHRPLSDGHRADLLKIETEFGASLRFYDLTLSRQLLDLADRVPRHKRLSDIVYARFVLDRFLPDDVTRLIYLDCDMMVVAPIETLWETDLGDKPVGAVEDPWGKWVGSGRDIRQHGVLDPADPYFNAGLLLIDIARWRAANVAEKLETHISDGTADRLQCSQNVLNLIFQGNWHRLDTLWNVVDPAPAHVSLNPYNLHYTGVSRPWHLFSRVGYARLYRHVMTNELFYRYWRFRMKKRIAKSAPFLKAR
ncbi:glycosyltransferase family 8 protein [Pelagibacterium halotolerans]|uniref:glycosyltransferase family 8 protein n=1 Tax=Pelagibacterium halotolerans TaxID=531813 RepID=UPI00384E07BC